MSNDHKSKPKRSKDKFETTTLLKLPSGDFEEEITINEPSKLSKKKNSSTADEETVKMTMKSIRHESKSSVEELLQKKALERKEKNHPKKSKQPQTVYVSKSKQTVYSNVLLEVPDKKPVPKRLIFMVLFVLVSIFSAWQWFHKPPSTSGTKKSVKVQPPEIKLSAIKLHDDANQPINTKALLPGQSFSISFAIQDWTSLTAPNLEASVRIYDHTGRMLYFKPSFAVFNTPSDPKSDRIELSTHFDLGQDTPPGFYKIILYITELENGLTAERQTRIKVVPKA